jgi:hypothetical protein
MDNQEDENEMAPNEVMELEPLPIHEFLACSELQYNDHGSANWYKEKYGGFDDRIYPILELYSRGIRWREFRNHLKKLKKKGKLLQDKTTPECVLRFENLNLKE